MCFSVNQLSSVCVCGCFLSNASCCFSSKGEECDDMNSMNGDGCSSQCKKETFFNCIGKSYVVKGMIGTFSHFILSLWRRILEIEESLTCSIAISRRMWL